MTKSERVSLIQQLATALAQIQPEIAYLTLDEFGVKHVNMSWDAAPMDVFVGRLQRAKNEALQELAAHLNLRGSTLSTDAGAERRLWAPGFCRCFLSHTSRYKTEAAALKVELEGYGCDVFVAHENIEPTLEWRREIENALASCHCLLALVTKDFHGSLWTDQEVGFVLGRGLSVVPIRADNDPYGLMGKLQAIPWDGEGFDDVAEPIFMCLNSKNQTAQLVASGAVQAFLDSGSFAMAKKRMGIVERLTAITPELRQRLSEATATNSQIAGSFGVPARLSRLLGKAD